jgi:putative phosphoribosyl transferase
VRPDGGPPYRDRAAAGRALVDALAGNRGRDDPVVLALPRGGLPVAAPVAAALAAPLGVVVVRKVGAPGRPELAMGALASFGGDVEQIVNTPVLHSLGIDTQTFTRAAAREAVELERRVHAFGAQQATVRDRLVIVVDDGLATGSTMRAAVTAVRRHQPAGIVVAVPVGALEAVEQLRPLADSVVCPCTPHPFRAVGLAYADFTQVAEEEAQRLLADHSSGR